MFSGMNSPRKIFAPLALAAALAAASLAGCSIVAPPDASGTGQSSAVAEWEGSATERPPGSGETGNRNPQSGPIGDHQSAVDALCGQNPAGTDLGPRFGASGIVEASDANGLATVYAVAPGDSYTAIVERFCLDSQDFAMLNGITNVGSVYEDDVYAFTEETVADARRAAGYDYPACPRTGSGYPDVASIRWASLPGDRARATDIGAPIDTGPAGTAQGETRLDADGELVEYVVASGDTWNGIEDRFCMDPYYVSSLTGQFGSGPMIHPGDVIPLQPAYLEIVTN